MAEKVREEEGAVALANQDHLLRMPGGTALEIEERAYVGGAKALLLRDAETREPYAILTVNVPGTRLGRDEILVKTWSPGNREVADVALSDPRFEDTGRRVATGRVEVEVWTYRPDAAPAKPAPVGDPRDLRGTAPEAIRESVQRHNVEAFASADWQSHGRLRMEDPRELASFMEAAQKASGGKAERVYTVGPQGQIHNTVTNRDEYVPVTEKMLLAEITRYSERVDGGSGKSKQGEPTTGNGPRGAGNDEPGISIN
jgi:hypothetical protein